MATILTHLGRAREAGRPRPSGRQRPTVGVVLAVALASLALLVGTRWPAASPPASALTGAREPTSSPIVAEARVDLVDVAGDGRDGVVERLSRDGLVLARGREDGALQVVDLVEGRERLLVGTGAPVSDLSLAADGRSLVARARDGALIIWRSGDGQPLVLRPLAGAVGCGACGAALVAGPEGGSVLAADGVGGIVLHDAETGARRAAWRAGRAAVRDAAFSADGRRVATIDREGGLRLWTNAGQALWSAVAPGGAAGRLAVSPDGRWLAVGGPGGTGLWDARAGRLHRRLTDPRAAPTDLAFSADGSALGILAADGAVELWDTATGLPRRRLASGELQLRATRYLAGPEPVVIGRGDGTYGVWKPA
jgi:WD40 repeat protein